MELQDNKDLMKKDFGVVRKKMDEIEELMDNNEPIPTESIQNTYDDARGHLARGMDNAIDISKHVRKQREENG